MSVRTNYVPLHSIIVTRDDVQVDALVEYNKTGKAFKFTEDEVKDIIKANDGNSAMSLRSPTDEVKTDDGETIVVPSGSDGTPTTVTTDDPTAAVKAEAAAKAKAEAAAKAKAKDTDL